MASFYLVINSFIFSQRGRALFSTALQSDVDTTMYSNHSLIKDVDFYAHGSFEL